MSGPTLRKTPRSSSMRHKAVAFHASNEQNGHDFGRRIARGTTGELKVLALFRRRNPHGLGRRFADFLWPSQGFRRSMRYIVLRTKRLPASPHAIAAGFASGAAVSFLPLIGLHFLLGFGLAWLVRGNLLASALGTAVGNPLTFPIIYSTAYRIGLQILEPGSAPIPVEDAPDVVAEGAAIVADGLNRGQIDSFLPMLKVTAVGAVPMAFVAFAVFYFLVFKFAARFQEAQRHRRLIRFQPAE